MSSELNAKIIRQIEYYLSDRNLQGDTFLLDLLNKNDGILQFFKFFFSFILSFT